MPIELFFCVYSKVGLIVSDTPSKGYYSPYSQQRNEECGILMYISVHSGCYEEMLAFRLMVETNKVFELPQQ